MAIRLDEMETANNREAEGASLTGRRMDMSEAFITAGANDIDDFTNADTGAQVARPDDAEQDMPLSEDQLMRLVRSAYHQGKSYQEQVLQPRWLSSYNAFNNKHSSDSKYSSARFRGRSRLFRPKTRATARKKQAEAAAALFSTSDALIVRATDESNPANAAGAELMNALLRFRLDRSNENSGIPWFQISMGAHLTGQQTGICISKQYWEYRRVFEGYDTVPVTVPTPPQLLPVVGQPEMVIGEEQVPRYRVVRDRPRIELMPPEDVVRDPTAAWEDQAQDSAYLILRFPMTIEAARTFLSQAADNRARVRFFDITDEALIAAAGANSDPSNAANIRRARETNSTDRFADFSVDQAYAQVYLHENFFRVQGRDYCFWTLGQDRLLSEPMLVEDAYPEQGGARPVVIGVGALEPFKIDPMAPVESWQELQREINDLVNLRLDTLKQTIAPLAKVVRGRSVDIRAIQNRTPDTVVYVGSLNDVEFDRPGQVAGESYIEMEKLNADFDDQAGNFSTGSVQTNRQLGETVGGMQMMMSNASALGEFDLRVWIETWVEPVLRQIVKLEQFYENDENVLAISAKRAKLMPRFGVSRVTNDLLNAQVTVYVDVGIGSSDPMISLQKFQQASQIALGLLGPGAQARLKQDAVIDEVFGKAGYKDASERFFNPSEEQDQRIVEMQQAMQQMQQALADAEKALADKSDERQTRIDVARINVVGNLARQEMSNQNQKETAFTNAAMQQVAAQSDREFERQKDEIEYSRTMEMQNRQQPQGVDTIRQSEPVQTIQSMLGLRPDPHMAMAAENAQAALQASQQVVSSLEMHQAQFVAALRQLMDRIDLRFTEMGNALARSNTQTVEAIRASGDQTAVAMMDMAQDQRTAMDELRATLEAPKKIIRGADGFASHVVIDRAAENSGD